MTLQRLDISKIKVGDRFRKDLGDIDGLAESISALGLLQPVVVAPFPTSDRTGNYRLVAGLRRLHALKKLEYDLVPVRVLNIEAMLQAEHDENVIRKDFTLSERKAITDALRTFEHGGNRKADQEANCPLDEAARRAGFSGKKEYQRTATVVANGTPELVEMMDTEEVSVSAAATVAHLPKPEQREVIAQGPEAVKAKAKEMREEAKPFPENSKTPHQEAEEDPGRRWSKGLHDLYVLLNSIRDLGGIKEVAHRWTEKNKASSAKQLEKICETLQEYIAYLKE